MQKNGFLVRQANNNDIETIKSVVFSVLREYGLAPSENGIDSDLADIETNYNNNNGYFGVITAAPDNKIVGTFGLYKVNDIDCEIRKMYFLPEARGKGMGKKVLRLLITKALEKGFQNILLETNSVLKEAIGLYEKSGFKKVESAHLSERCDQAFRLELLNVT
jgi:putative acetyltransferase